MTNFKADHMGRGVQRTDNVRPAGRIKQWRKSSGDGSPREERVETMGETGNGKDWIKEGDQRTDRNMEERDDAKERKRNIASVEKEGAGDLSLQNTRKLLEGPAAPPQRARPGHPRNQAVLTYEGADLEGVAQSEAYHRLVHVYGDHVH